MIGKFFYTPKAKQFTYKPRFYNPEKEEREERERRIKEELGIADEKRTTSKGYRPNIKGQFRSSEGLSRSSDDARKSQNRRLIYLVLLLAFIFYLFFYSGLF